MVRYEDRFYVLVLRHNPIDLIRYGEPGFRNPPEGAMDSTGPVCWLNFWPKREPSLHNQTKIWKDFRYSESSSKKFENSVGSCRSNKELIENIEATLISCRMGKRSYENRINTAKFHDEEGKFFPEMDLTNLGTMKEQLYRLNQKLAMSMTLLTGRASVESNFYE